jgi:hypothetical protein
VLPGNRHGIQNRHVSKLFYVKTDVFLLPPTRFQPEKENPYAGPLRRGHQRRTPRHFFFGPGHLIKTGLAHLIKAWLAHLMKAWLAHLIQAWLD